MTVDEVREQERLAWAEYEAQQRAGSAWQELNAGPRASTKRVDETEEKAA